MSNYISMRTVYRIKGTHIKSVSFPFLCIASGNCLTLDKSFVAKRAQTTRNTLFTEIEVVPRNETLSPATRKFFSDSPPIHEESQECYLRRVATSFTDTIHDLWDPTSSHIILHSSGIDSRLISHSIKQLHIQYGDEWLGNVIFVSTKWEQAEFIRIMKYEGWDKSQYYCPGTGVEPNEYYAPELLDFSNTWRRTGGISSIPVNLFYYLGEAARWWSMYPLPVQTIAGYFGNETLDAAASPVRSKGVNSACSGLYNMVMTQRPIYGETVSLPFTSTEYLKTVSESSIRLGRKLRPSLLAYMDSGLAEFTNVDTQGDRNHKAADWIMVDVMDNYRNSWYGQKVHPDAAPRHSTTEFQPFWAHYCAASLCEYLRKSKVEVRVK